MRPTRLLKRMWKASLRAILTTAALGLAGCAGGIFPTGSLGDRVWLDANGNGIQDASEQGEAGVEVVLYDRDGEVVAATTTDEAGLYAFAELRSGEYVLEFLPPPDKSLTWQNIGDDEFDSDPHPRTGRTSSFRFSGRVGDNTKDAGLWIRPEETPRAQPTPVPTPRDEARASPGTFEIQAEYVRTAGLCGDVEEYDDTLIVVIGQDGRTIVIVEKSTVETTSGMIQSDGSFQTSSPRESFTGQLEFSRDLSGNVTQVDFSARNSRRDGTGCVEVFQVDGESSG